MFRATAASRLNSRFVGIAAVSGLFVPCLLAQYAPIADAVRNGQYDLARKLLEHNADPNATDLELNSPLMWAAARGNIGMANALIEKGALVNYGQLQQNQREDALHFAVENHQAAMVDFLLSRGAAYYPISFPDPKEFPETLNEYSRLCQNFERKDPAAIQACPVRWRQAAFDNLLLLALPENAERVTATLAAGARPTADLRGVSAVEIAASGRSQQAFESLRALLAAGVPARLRNRALESALNPSNDTPPNPKMIALFGSLPQKNRDLVAAVKANDVRAVRTLIQQGADAHCLLAGRYRLIDDAVARGNKELVQVLLEAGEQMPIDKPLKSLSRLHRASEALASDSAKRIQTTVEWYLTQMANARAPWSATRAYLFSLQTMADVLDSHPAPDEVTEIANDLAAKQQYCKDNGSGLGGSVPVEVHTKGPAGEVSKWQIYYLLKIYEKRKDMTPQAFPAWSSPTTRTVDPGRYWMWAENPFTHALSERKLVPLTGTGLVTVDLAVQ